MRLRNVEEMEGTAGAAAPIHRRGSDGTVGDGRRRSLPCHLEGEPILPHGGSYFSKWLECFPILDKKATTVARKLVYEIVARYGAFRELHSDQGTNFGSKVVLEVCRLFGIHKTRTTQYHPRSDGFIERSFRTLGRCLKAACREKKQEWDELVPLILMSYRATPQARTGVTPNMMMLGRQTRLPVQAMHGAPLGHPNGACTRGYDDEGTSAHTARLKNARLTPLSKIGRTTCRTPKSSVWSTTTRSSGKNMPQASS